METKTKYLIAGGILLGLGIVVVVFRKPIGQFLGLTDKPVVKPADTKPGTTTTNTNVTPKPDTSKKHDPATMGQDAVTVQGWDYVSEMIIGSIVNYTKLSTATVAGFKPSFLSVWKPAIDGMQPTFMYNGNKYETYTGYKL
jgi:hypothetical protein